MTSVQNHQRPLSGNSFPWAGIFIVVLLTFSLQGCAFLEDLFQGKDRRPTPQRPDEKKEVEIREVEWEDVTDEEGVITEYPDQTPEKEEIYDVLCLLPFNGNNKDRGRSLYAGIKMAAQELNPQVNIRVTTLDISRLIREPEALRKVLSVPDFDIIIGPYGTEDMKQVLELTQGSGAMVFSPWNTNPSIRGYNHYVQLNPGLESHFRGIVDWTAREYGVPQTLIVANKKDANSVAILQDAHNGLDSYYTAINPTEDIPILEEMIVSKDIQAIIIPSWRASDEAYFLSLLSAVNAARGNRTISVFLLSSWMNHDNINYEQYSGLRLHFTNSRFKNPNSRTVTRFEDQYIREFNYFADDDVFYGHDIFRMTLEMLSRYDRQIQKEIINYECRDCFFQYDFVEEMNEQGRPFILNDHVDIINLSNFQYHRLN